MRHENDNYRDSRDEREPRWLHDQEHGQNSRRGNYTVDSNFNLGYGAAYDKDYGDQRTFNTNAEQGHMYPEGRFQPGGAQYAGEDYSRSGRQSQNNPLGVTHVGNRYNSGRHYDSRVDYSNRDYENMRHNPRPSERYGMPDERFGHDVSRSRDDNYMGHSSRGDYESYRRYEQPNRRYDNDYRGGFNSRNYSDEGRPHYGEDTSYSNLERWQGRSDQRRDRYSDDRGNR